MVKRAGPSTSYPTRTFLLIPFSFSGIPHPLNTLYFLYYTFLCISLYFVVSRSTIINLQWVSGDFWNIESVEEIQRKTELGSVLFK